MFNIFSKKGFFHFHFLYIVDMASFGYSLLLVLTAFIWGSGFVAQIEGNTFGPFAFSCIRCFIAAGFLALVFKILDAFGKSPRRPRSPAETRPLALVGERFSFRPMLSRKEKSSAAISSALLPERRVS